MPYGADAVIVLFRNSEVDAEEIMRISEEEEAYQQEASKLGFTSLLAQKTLERRVNTAKLLFPPFSSEEMKIWAAFLPTMHHVGEYDFDEPPVAVLSAIKDAIDLKIFDRIVVLDPRGNTAKERFWNTIDSTFTKIDPIAFGVIYTPNGQRWHPIVRWGESKLLSLDEVKQFVVRTKKNLRYRFIGILLALLLAENLILTAYVYFMNHRILGTITTTIAAIGSVLFVIATPLSILAMKMALMKFSEIPVIDRHTSTDLEPEEEDPIEY
jgi:hypothetical protein